MNTDDSLFKQLLETFAVELESLLLVITDNLHKIEQGAIDDDLPLLITEIARSGRNIKVAALSVGVQEVASLAEYIEQLFIPEISLSAAQINLSKRAVESMREAMQLFRANKPCSVNIRDVLHQLQQEIHVTEQGTAEIPLAVEKSPATVVVPSVTVNPSEREFLKKIVATFSAELQDNLIKITDNLLQLEKGDVSEQDFSLILDELFRAAHNIKGSARGVGAVNVGEIAHHMETLFAAIRNKNVPISLGIINICLQSIDYMNEAMHSYREETPISFDLQNHVQLLRQYTEFPQQEAPTINKSMIEQLVVSEKPKQNSDVRSRVKEDESIRVPLHNLDRISADMEEIQIVKIAIEEHYAELNQINFKIDYLVRAWKKGILNLQNLLDEEEVKNFDKLFSSHLVELAEISNAAHKLQRGLRAPVNDLSALLNSLQDEIGTIRLIPIESQLQYLPRIVRDLANELKKPINFSIKNNDVKIDKIILDGLKDPLIHLLRNAIDHGIENAERRAELGKPVQGTISIDVCQEDHQIVFKISDDGAGIRPEELIRSALAKNLITPVELESMSAEDVLDIIFRPGFSTREIATNISGRGVGLDVVRSNLTQLKGQVTVDSQLGQGSHFFLRVPITLATERGLIVVCGQQKFIILTSSVESVLLINKKDVIEVEGSNTVLVKQQPILLCSLSNLLYLNENKENIKEQLSVVVVKKNNECVALLVDEIIGEKEVVLKSLQEPLTNMPLVIGASLTGSSQINFVLNSTEIIKRALLS